MQIIYYLSSKFLPRSLSIIFILAGPFIYDLPIVNSLPWNIPLALQYLPYYAFANIYKDYITNLGKSSLPKVVIPLIVTLFGLTIVHQVPTPLQAPLRILLGGGMYSSNLHPDYKRSFKSCKLPKKHIRSFLCD